MTICTCIYCIVYAMHQYRVKRSMISNKGYSFIGGGKALKIPEPFTKQNMKGYFYFRYFLVTKN